MQKRRGGAYQASRGRYPKRVGQSYSSAAMGPAAALDQKMEAATQAYVPQRAAVNGGLVAADGVVPGGGYMLQAQGNGVSAAVTVTPTAPVAAPQPAVECQFRAQTVKFQRDINIINTPPNTVSQKTDVCGNVIQVTEEMDRIMTATDWRPVPGTESDLSGPVEMITAQPNGEYTFDQGEAHLVNSRSVPANAEVVPGPYPTTNPDVFIPLVGKRQSSTANSAGSRHAAAMLRRYRGA